MTNRQESRGQDRDCACGCSSSGPDPELCRVQKLGPFGAEADSIDAPFREIWDAFFAAQVLVFRAQELTAERYL